MRVTWGLLSNASNRTLPSRILDVLSTPLKENGALISVIGRIRSVRKEKRRTFFSLVDGSCERGLQVVVENPENDWYVRFIGL